jgi:hypothetical protein
MKLSVSDPRPKQHQVIFKQIKERNKKNVVELKLGEMALDMIKLLKTAQEELLK